MKKLKKKVIVVRFSEWKDDEMEEETNNCASLVKEQKFSNCFILTRLGKQIYLIVYLSEQKDNGIKGSLIARD